MNLPGGTGSPVGEPSLEKWATLVNLPWEVDDLLVNLSERERSPVSEHPCG